MSNCRGSLPSAETCRPCLAVACDCSNRQCGAFMRRGLQSLSCIQGSHWQSSDGEWPMRRLRTANTCYSVWAGICAPVPLESPRRLPPGTDERAHSPYRCRTLPIRQDASSVDGLVGPAGGWGRIAACRGRHTLSRPFAPQSVDAHVVGRRRGGEGCAKSSLVRVMAARGQQRERDRIAGGDRRRCATWVCGEVWQQQAQGAR